MIDASSEQRQPATGEGFADAVTVSWADDAHGWYGMARLGMAEDAKGSALAVVFHGREPAAALALGGLELPTGAGWDDVELAGLRMAIDAPLERWTVSCDGTDQSFELHLEAISAPAQLPGADPVARLGGMEGYEQLVRVRGHVAVAGRRADVDGVGQRGHSWGLTDWSKLELVRTVGAWFGESHGGVVLSALRPAGAQGHDEEAVWAAVVAADSGDAAPVADPRLSTTYDGDGHQRRAGLELWATDEADFPHRFAGEVVCGSSFDLGALRLDMAFMRWHGEGARGVGRYDVLRKA